MPTTVNRKLSIPGTGTEVGVWGANDLNPNFAIIDAISGSVATLGLAGSGPITLTDAQQQVAIIRLTGALVANVAVTVTEPAFWIIDNQTTGNFVVTIGGATGSVIATAQGSRTTVAYDGTNAGFVDQGEPGTYKKFAVSTVPLWITACTVNPYLPCQGGTFLGATYPALAALLGTTFGGNGITTFGLPDLQGRANFDIDNGAGRLTNATMSTNGTIGGAGGAQTQTLTQAQLPVTIVNQTLNYGANGFIGGSVGTFSISGGPGTTLVTGNTGNLNANITINPATFGSGAAHPIMPPALITGITFIKT